MYNNEQMRSLIHKNTVQETLSTLNTNQLSLTISLIHTSADQPTSVQ